MADARLAKWKRGDAWYITRGEWTICKALVYGKTRYTVCRVKGIVGCVDTIEQALDIVDEQEKVA